MQTSERILSGEEETAPVHLTVDLKNTGYAKFRNVYDKTSERELFSRRLNDVLDEMDGGNPDLMAHYLERQNERNRAKHVFDRLGLNKKHVATIKILAEVQGLDAVGFVAKDVLVNHVEGMLDYWTSKRPKEVKKLRAILKRKDLDLAHDMSPLDELGTHYNTAYVIKTLAEWDEQSIETFCKEGIIATIEGRLGQPEVIGELFCQKLKGLLEKED